MSDDLRPARGMIAGVGIVLGWALAALALHACVAHAQPGPPPSIRTLAPATTNSIVTTPSPQCSGASGGACAIDIKIGPRFRVTSTTAPGYWEAGSGALPNAASLPPGTNAVVAGADGTQNAWMITAFGSASQLIGMRAQGTRATPTQLTAGNTITAIMAYGYDGSGAYSTVNTCSAAMQADENWTDATHHGTRWVLSCAKLGAPGTTEWMRASNGQLLIGQTTPCGNAATSGECVTGQSSFTGAARGVPATLTISTATFTPNFDTAQNFTFQLVHASCPCTLANPSTTLVAGQSGMLQIKQSSTGSDTIGTWGSAYAFSGGTATITLSTGANAIDYIPYYVDATATTIVLGSVITNPVH